MTIKQRIQRFEKAAPKGDEGIAVCWRSIVTRSGDVLTEAVHSAFILGHDTAPGMEMEHQPGEEEKVFLRNVLDRACIDWGRHDEAFRDSIRWEPGADTQATH